MNGILLVDKPGGMTSHDVVDFVRKRTGVRKVGHAGTLDPMATGLIIILVGDATKMSERFVNDDKAYRANIVLGIATDTGDKEGRVIEEKSFKAERGNVEKILNQFIGCIEQVPPMYSAKKYKGKKLYEYARKGVEIKRNPQKINIKKIDMLNFSGNVISLEIFCSKGTYIRQLAVDIGRALGTGAHVSELRRICSGSFSVENAIRFEELKEITKHKLYESLIRY